MINMKLVLNFDEERDKDLIDYIKNYDKAFLRDIGKDAIAEYIRDEIERKETRRIQSKCKHDYKETSRSCYDENGERYYDDDGEYRIVEWVTWRCKKCDHWKGDYVYSDSRWDYL